MYKMKLIIVINLIYLVESGVFFTVTFFQEAWSLMIVSDPDLTCWVITDPFPDPTCQVISDPVTDADR